LTLREVLLMAITDEPDIAEPGADEFAFGDGPSFRRVLVPVRLAADAAQTLAVAARVCQSANGTLQLLHIRIFDPPTRGFGRFYPQTKSEAAAAADEALPIVWSYGVQATTAVVEAPRGGIAPAIAQQAATWHADVIVMTRRPRLAISRLVLGSVADDVMRKTSCPVLAVHPRPKVNRRHAARDH
jgi:nucleotide-binding universal stress UspA family protein